MISMTVRFNSEVITNTSGRKFVPLLDTGCTLEQFEVGLSKLKEKYKVISIFIAGHSIVGSCADIGDYTCLTAEVEELPKYW